MCELQFELRMGWFQLLRVDGPMHNEGLRQQPQPVQCVHARILLSRAKADCCFVCYDNVCTGEDVRVLDEVDGCVNMLEKYR